MSRSYIKKRRPFDTVATYHVVRMPNRVNKHPRKTANDIRLCGIYGRRPQMKPLLHKPNSVACLKFAKKHIYNMGNVHVLYCGQMKQWLLGKKQVSAN